MKYSFSLVFLVLLTLYSCDKNEEIETDSPQGSIKISGTGTLVFDDHEPLSDKPVTLYYHIPEAATENSPILMVFHGAGRDAEDSRDELITKANQYRTIIVVPEFSRTYFPNGDAYNLGNVFIDGDNPSPQTLNPEAEWTFSLVEPIFDLMKRVTSNQSETYQAFGFSAGAQFLHRFLMFKPDARVSKAVSGSAGWYTMPDFQVDFPYGLGESPVQESSLSTLFGHDLTVLVGEADNDPNANSLRHNQEADRQGSNRLDRAQYFYNQSRTIASNRNLSFNWKYRSIPNVAHNFQTVGEYAFDSILSN